MALLDESFIDTLSGAQLVSHYLMSSYAYQFLHRTYLTDEAYDKLCHRLYREYDQVQHHHKDLVDKEALQATTGYYLKASEYPLIVKMAAQTLVEPSSQKTS